MREQTQASTLDLEEIAGWLLEAADDPNRARYEWAEKKVALIRCGKVFASIRVNAKVVFAAAGTSEPADVIAYLENALLGGPVFTDSTAAWFYCLVSPSTCGSWQQSKKGTLCMADDHYLGVPRLDVVTPEQGRSFWCVRPTGREHVGSPDAVSQMVSVGVFRLAHPERTG